MFGLNKEEVNSLLHMTGSNDETKEPLWRNYANLSPYDGVMISLREKKLVKCELVSGYAATGMWIATEKGKEIARSIYWRKFGPKLVKNLRRKLNSANSILWNEGHKHFSEFED